MSRLLLSPLLAGPIAQIATPGAAEAGPGIVDFFLEAGPMAKLVLAVLVGFSLGSWAIMIWKQVQVRKANAQTDRFLEVFRKSARFSEVNSAAPNLEASPLVGIFQAGYAEIDAQIKAAQAKAGRGPVGEEAPAQYRIRSLASLERTLRRAIAVETRQLAKGTPFLATTAASTPFIGLFGTVWGIMVAFQEIGFTGSSSIVAVAPGIAEALVNTAAGLVAAIPALIGYNHFAARLRQLRGRMEDFALELVNLAERNFT
jgi:biopolymer transport protein TolQ